MSRSTRVCLAASLAAALAGGISVGAAQTGHDGGKGAMATFTEQNNNGMASAHVGDVLELRLAENATTGYRWVVAPLAQDVVALVESSADYPGGAVGSGGVAIFRFRALAPGRAELTLRNMRSWEGEASAQRQFRLEVTVER